MNCQPQFPPLVIGAPVGFNLESKATLPIQPNQIRVEGRKGGSSVAAAILNALSWLGGRGGAGEQRSRGAGEK